MQRWKKKKKMSTRCRRTWVYRVLQMLQLWKYLSNWRCFRFTRHRKKEKESYNFNLQETTTKRVYGKTESSSDILTLETARSIVSSSL